MARHTGYPWGFPFGCWRGMIIEGDHDLDLQIFRNVPIAIGTFLAATSCSLLQQPSLSPSLHLPISPSPKSQVPRVPSPKSQVPSPGVPSPKSQVPSPGVPEAVDAVVPAGSRWCCTSNKSSISMVITLLCCPTGSTGCPLGPTGVLIDPVAAILLEVIGCWFPLRRLKLICSSPGVKSTCTLISRVDLDSADGVRAHNFWMYCTYLVATRTRTSTYLPCSFRRSLQATQPILRDTSILVKHFLSCLFGRLIIQPTYSSTYHG